MVYENYTLELLPKKKLHQYDGALYLEKYSLITLQIQFFELLLH